MNKLALLCVFLGGGFGSIMRHLVVEWSSKHHFTVGVLISNALASIILGAIAGWALKNFVNPHVWLFLAVGFTGGFSTFSTFSKHNVDLLVKGEFMYCFLNVTLSVLVGMGAFFLSFYCFSKSY